jgi:hypothetical protein
MFYDRQTLLSDTIRSSIIIENEYNDPGLNLNIKLNKDLPGSLIYDINQSTILLSIRRFINNSPIIQQQINLQLSSFNLINSSQNYDEYLLTLNNLVIPLNYHINLQLFIRLNNNNTFINNVSLEKNTSRIVNTSFNRVG